MPRDYKQAIRDDLIEQFRGKEKINDLVEVVGEQLESVYGFLEELLGMHDLENAEGILLDKIGELVGLTREDAADIIGAPTTAVTITDNEYRALLKSKILRNTSRGTYQDILEGIKLFADVKNVGYSESDDDPATFFLDFKGINWDETTAIKEAKAAGVNAVREFTLPEHNADMYTAIALQIIKTYNISEEE